MRLLPVLLALSACLLSASPVTFGPGHPFLAVVSDHDETPLTPVSSAGNGSVRLPRLRNSNLLVCRHLQHAMFFCHLLQEVRGHADGNRRNKVAMDESVEISRAEIQTGARCVAQGLRTSRRQGGPDGRGIRRELRAKSSFAASIGIRFAVIPAGSFLMGSPENEEGRDSDESQHCVRISKHFRMGCTEVTKGQFAAFVRDTGYRTEAEREGTGGFGFELKSGIFPMGSKYTWQNSGFPQTDDHPVVNVSWNDAQAFIEWLSRKDGLRYCLPAEAEWEYACRAGSTTRFWHGGDAEGLAQISNVADGTAKAEFGNWTTISARDGFIVTAPVGRFPPNKFGLHDMHGNVWEWCADWYDLKDSGSQSGIDPAGPNSGSFRVMRGGAWAIAPDDARSASRLCEPPDSRSTLIGFRLVSE